MVSLLRKIIPLTYLMLTLVSVCMLVVLCSANDISLEQLHVKTVSEMGHVTKTVQLGSLTMSFTIPEHKYTLFKVITGLLVLLSICMLYREYKLEYILTVKDSKRDMLVDQLRAQVENRKQLNDQIQGQEEAMSALSLTNLSQLKKLKKLEQTLQLQQDYHQALQKLSALPQDTETILCETEIKQRTGFEQRKQYQNFVGNLNEIIVKRGLAKKSSMVDMQTYKVSFGTGFQFLIKRGNEAITINMEKILSGKRLAADNTTMIALSPTDRSILLFYECCAFVMPFIEAKYAASVVHNIAQRSNSSVAQTQKRVPIQTRKILTRAMLQQNKESGDDGQSEVIL